MPVQLGSAYGKVEIDVSGVKASADTARQALGSVEGALGGVSAKSVAVGTIMAQAFTGALGAFKSLAESALGAVAKHERLEQSLTSLVARELMQQSTVTETVKVGQQLIAATEDQIKVAGKSKKSVDDVKFAIEGHNLSLQRAQERYAKLVASGKATEAQLASAQHAIAAQERAIAKLNGQLTTVPGKAAHMVTVYETVTRTTLDMATAKKQAAERVKELMDWTQKLAILSPFSQDDVAQSFKMALAYGFTSEEAQRLTQATIDFASGSGASGEVMNRIALALGQIKAKGNLAGGEILQLTEAGINVREALLSAGNVTGLTAENFSKMQEKGLIPADKAIEAIVGRLEKDFAGAARDSAGSFAGLIASLGDLKNIALRDMFTPMFKAVQPYLDKFVSALQDEGVRGALQQIGSTIGQVVTGGMDRLAGLFGQISAGIDTFRLALQVTGDPLQAFKRALQTILPPEARTSIQTLYTVLSTVFTFIQNNGPAVQQAVTGIVSAIAGFMVATRVASAIGSIGLALTTLTNPIGLVGAVLGALVVGWQTNFMGMRDTLTSVWTQMQPHIAALVNWLQTNIPVAIQAASTIWNTTLLPALQAVGTFITTQVVPAISNVANWLQLNLPTAVQSASTIWNTVLLPALQAVGTFITTSVIPAISNIVNWLQTNIPAAIRTGANFWNTTLLPALKGVYTFMNDTMFPLFRAISDFIKAVLGKAVEALGGLWQNVLYPALEAVGKWVEEHILPGFEGIGKVINDVVMPALKPFIDGVLKDLRIGFEKVRDLIKDVTGFFDGLAKQVADFKLPDFLQRHSPSPLEQTFMGVRDTLKQINAMGTPDFSKMGLPAMGLPQNGAGMPGMPAGSGQMAQNSDFMELARRMLNMDQTQRLPPMILQVDGRELARVAVNNGAGAATSDRLRNLRVQVR
jgi:tape measure domain-containing protein